MQITLYTSGTLVPSEQYREAYQTARSLHTLFANALGLSNCELVVNSSSTLQIKTRDTTITICKQNNDWVTTSAKVEQTVLNQLCNQLVSQTYDTRPTKAIAQELLNDYQNIAEAVTTLDAEVTALKEQNALLKNENSRLQAENAKLRNQANTGFASKILLPLLACTSLILVGAFIRSHK